MAGCAEAEPWRFLYDQAVERKEVLEHLRAAVEKRDEAAIVEWTRQPCLAGYPLPAAWAEPIRAARARARRTEAMLAALEKGEPAAFYEVFDVRLVRRSAERFAPYQALLAEWIRAEVLPPEKLGLQRRGRGQPGGRQRAGGGLARAVDLAGRRGWPTAACWPFARPSPTAADDPQTVAAHFRLSRSSGRSGTAAAAAA